MKTRQIEVRRLKAGVDEKRIEEKIQVYTQRDLSAKSPNIVVQCQIFTFIFILYMLGHYINTNLNEALRKCWSIM